MTGRARSKKITKNFGTSSWTTAKMTDYTRRMRQLITTVDETDDWADLSIEDAIAIVLAVLVTDRAQAKFPDLFVPEST